MADDVIDACRQVSFICLRGGDISPLLLCRLEGEPKTADPKWLKGFQEYGLHTWALGNEMRPPRFASAVSDGKVSVEDEPVGKICSAYQFNHYADEDGLWSFSIIVKFVSGITGRNVHKFIFTICTRIYGVDSFAVEERLSRPNYQATLQVAFDYLDTVRFSPEGGFWPFDLKRKLADAMGLSLAIFCSPGSYATSYNRSPLDHATFAGRSAQGGRFGGLFNVCCNSCRTHSGFRAGTWEMPSFILDATMYRIHGLQYEWSLKDGVGIIVKDKRILGRMGLWKAHACSCRTLEQIELDRVGFGRHRLISCYWRQMIIFEISLHRYALGDIYVLDTTTCVSGV